MQEYDNILGLGMRYIYIYIICIWTNHVSTSRRAVTTWKTIPQWPKFEAGELFQFIHMYILDIQRIYIYIYAHRYANICVYKYIQDIHNIYILILSRVWCHSHFLFFGRLISLMLVRILTSHLLFHPLLIYSLLLQSSNFYMVSKWIWAPKWDVVICEIHSFF